MKSKVRTVSLREANFPLFKELVGPLVKLPQGQGVRKWQIFEDAFHRVQELRILRCEKLKKEGKR